MTAFAARFNLSPERGRDLDGNWGQAERLQYRNVALTVGGVGLFIWLITAVKRIYHLPTNRYYDETDIDESRGERWFCSESEAVAAGWRPAKV